jgi:hypothetical protein
VNCQRLLYHSEIFNGQKEGGNLLKWPEEMATIIHQRLESDRENTSLYSYLYLLQQLLLIKDAKTPEDFIIHTCIIIKHFGNLKALPLGDEIKPELRETFNRCCLQQSFFKDSSTPAFLEPPKVLEELISNPPKKFNGGILKWHEAQYLPKESDARFKLIAEAFNSMIKILISPDKKPPCFAEISKKILADLVQAYQARILPENYKLIVALIDRSNSMLGKTGEEFLKAFQQAYTAATMPKLDKVSDSLWWKQPTVNSTSKPQPIVSPSQSNPKKDAAESENDNALLSNTGLN